MKLIHFLLPSLTLALEGFTFQASNAVDRNAPDAGVGPGANQTIYNRPPTARGSAFSNNVIAYFTNWGIYGRNYQVADIPVGSLTHIFYAFAKPNADGSVVQGDSYADTDKAFPGDSWDTNIQPYRGNFWQLKLLKQKQPFLKVILSIGGWTWSGDFSTIAASQATRDKFAASCVSFVTTYGFDGVDLDWEYPVLGGLPSNTYNPADGKNYVLLLKAIRDAFNQLPNGNKLIISIAAPAGLDKVAQLDIPGLAQYLDILNIMSYDFRGGWSSSTGHQTNLYADTTDDNKLEKLDVVTALQYYISHGFPAKKINIGGAIYGRGFTGVPNKNNGLHQTFTGVPKGTWDDGSSGLTGVFDYKDVLAKVQSGQVKRYFDEVAHATYAYDGSSLWITYDDVQSITDKASYIKANGIGGIMFWELSGDSKTSSQSLVSTAFNALLSNQAPPISPPPSNPSPPPPTSNPSPPPPTSNPSPPPPTSNPSPPPPMGNPSPSPPTGNPSSPPSSGHGHGCVTADSRCTPLVESLGCAGHDIAFCTWSRKWSVQSCAPGTSCEIGSSGTIACQWDDQLDPSAVHCFDGPPKDPAGPPSSNVPTSPPPSQPSSPPSSKTVCKTAGSRCKFLTDSFACGGTDLVVCGNDNKWAVQACAKGTKCQSLNSQVGCQWNDQIDPDAVTC